MILLFLKLSLYAVNLVLKLINIASALSGTLASSTNFTFTASFCNFSIKIFSKTFTLFFVFTSIIFF